MIFGANAGNGVGMGVWMWMFIGGAVWQWNPAAESVFGIPDMAWKGKARGSESAEALPSCEYRRNTYRSTLGLGMQREGKMVRWSGA